MKKTMLGAVALAAVVLMGAGCSRSNGVMQNDAMMNGNQENGVMVGGALMVPSKTIVENASNASNVTTLVAAVKAAGLVDTLNGAGPFTVFAPTNDAFNKLPAGTVDTLLKPENKAMLTTVLTYHVVPGRYLAKDITNGMTLKTVQGETLTFKVENGKVWINGVAMVQTADVISKNGVTHVIDTVLTPAADAMSMNSGDLMKDGVMVGGALMVPSLDIVDNAVNASNVTTVVAAVKAAGLVTTLKGKGPFTVFAPTNDAFNKLPTGTVDTLLKPENKSQLVKILTYHVVAGRYLAKDLKDGMTLKTVEGETIKFSMKDGKVWVNGSAMVETPDVISKNGVTHVIDGVLLPAAAK